jgi:hypothetical protein
MHPKIIFIQFHQSHIRFEQQHASNKVITQIISITEGGRLQHEDVQGHIYINAYKHN